MTHWKYFGIIKSAVENSLNIIGSFLKIGRYSLFCVYLNDWAGISSLYLFSSPNRLVC